MTEQELQDLQDRHYSAIEGLANEYELNKNQFKFLSECCANITLSYTEDRVKELEEVIANLKFELEKKDSVISAQRKNNTACLNSKIAVTNALTKVFNMSEDSGREGCKYGDTDYDSVSAVYGYNLCLSQVKETIKNNTDTNP